MPKVDYKDLEEVTKFLDKLNAEYSGKRLPLRSSVKSKLCKELSKMIKDKYTEIKPDYDRTN
jgi:hypothetical protein